MTSQLLLDSFLGVASCVSAPTFPHVLMFNNSANRATIQLLGTGSPLSSHRTSSQCTSQSGPGRMAAQHPEKKTLPIYLPEPNRMWVLVTSRLSSQTRRPMPLLTKKAHREDVLSREWSFLVLALINGIFKPKSKWLWSFMLANALSRLSHVKTHHDETWTKSAVGATWLQIKVCVITGCSIILVNRI